jgi:hypothetical protein
MEQIDLSAFRGMFLIKVKSNRQVTNRSILINK